MPFPTAIIGSTVDCPFEFVVVVQAFAVYEAPERVWTTIPAGRAVIVLDTAVGELVTAPPAVEEGPGAYGIPEAYGILEPYGILDPYGILEPSGILARWINVANVVGFPPVGATQEQRA